MYDLEWQSPVADFLKRQLHRDFPPYVSFMLHLNNKHDVDKLQKLQNRCLRMCFDVINPRDVTVQRFHEMAHINMLYTRRDIQLLNIMFNLKKCE